jgi:hypothetical protein
VRQYIADGKLGFTVYELNASPVVRIEYEEAIAIGDLGETIDATRSKSWGDGPYVMPLDRDDWFFPDRITYIYRENCRYNARFHQRKRLKELLADRRPLVEEAKRLDKAMFLYDLDPADAGFIEARTGPRPSEFWQACRGKPFGTLPRSERQPLLFDEIPTTATPNGRPPLTARLQRLAQHYAGFRTAK